MEDVNACDGIGRCLRVLSRRRRNAHAHDSCKERRASLAALDILKRLTRRFGLDVVDRVLARDGARVVGDLLAGADDHVSGTDDHVSGTDDDVSGTDDNLVDEIGENGDMEGTADMEDTAACEREQQEIRSRALLLLCRWAALSPTRLQGSFGDFWGVLRAGENTHSRRHLAYAFCGVCVLSTVDIDWLLRLCLSSTADMRAVCAGLEAYHGRFPYDRMPRMVMEAMMAREGARLTRQAMEVGVGGLAFLQACGHVAGAAILRQQVGREVVIDSELAEFVVTSVGAAKVFDADADEGTRKQIVCALLEDAICGANGELTEPFIPTRCAPSEQQWTRSTGSAGSGKDEMDKETEEQLTPPFPPASPPASPAMTMLGLQKETSMDSIVLDTLCMKNSEREDACVTKPRQSLGAKRGLQMIMDAYDEACAGTSGDTDGFGRRGASCIRRAQCGTHSPQAPQAKRSRREAGGLSARAGEGDGPIHDTSVTNNLPLTIRIGTMTTLAFTGRQPIVDRVGVVSLFEHADSNTIDLPGSLPTVIPDENRFARACTEVFRFLVDNNNSGDKGEDDKSTTMTVDCSTYVLDAATAAAICDDGTKESAILDRWIVADYLNVQSDSLHAALYKASTPGTIARLLERFPHMTPILARCAWQSMLEKFRAGVNSSARGTTTGTTTGTRAHTPTSGPTPPATKRLMSEGTSPNTTQMIVEGVYTHLCECLSESRVVHL